MRSPTTAKGEEIDSDVREIQFLKNNYRRQGDSIQNRWEGGVFVPESAPASFERMARCAQVEPRRERLASHCLTLAGYEIYQPLLREQRRSHGRKITVTPPLFPGYLFLWVVSGWWNARWAAGVRRLVMDGPVPARVPDHMSSLKSVRASAPG
jgi:hypothetical protein